MRTKHLTHRLSKGTDKMKIEVFPTHGSVEKTVDILGDTEEVKRDLSQAELSQIMLEINGRKISLEDVISELNLNQAILVSDGDIPYDTVEEGEKGRGGEDDGIQISDPPIVDPSDIESDTNRTFYNRLINNKESQPATMRQIIFHEENLSKKRLAALMSEEGYNPESSGFGASLRVLSEITKEITREGRGPNEDIAWVGSK